VKEEREAAIIGAIAFLGSAYYINFVAPRQTMGSELQIFMAIYFVVLGLYGYLRIAEWLNLRKIIKNHNAKIIK
jgi:hypothetical protein